MLHIRTNKLHHLWINRLLFSFSSVNSHEVILPFYNRDTYQYYRLAFTTCIVSQGGASLWFSEKKSFKWTIATDGSVCGFIKLQFQLPTVVDKTVKTDAWSSSFILTKNLLCCHADSPFRGYPVTPFWKSKVIHSLLWPRWQKKNIWPTGWKE